MFITVEGIEGSGKTTQHRLLVDRLKKNFGEDNVVGVREPGGTDVAERCRNILLHGYEDSTPLTEAFLVAAARASVVKKVIQPALDAGKIVVCDRYVDTTYTIQGYGMGIPLDHLRTICGISTGGLMPDLTIFLDVDPSLGYYRKKSQQAQQHDEGVFEEFNHMDERAKDLGEKYRVGYYELIAQDSSRWLIVSSDYNRLVTPEKIHDMLNQTVMSHKKMMPFLWKKLTNFAQGSVDEL